MPPKKAATAAASKKKSIPMVTRTPISKKAAQKTEQSTPTPKTPKSAGPTQPVTPQTRRSSARKATAKYTPTTTPTKKSPAVEKTNEKKTSVEKKKAPMEKLTPQRKKMEVEMEHKVEEEAPEPSKSPSVRTPKSATTKESAAKLKNEKETPIGSTPVRQVRSTRRSGAVITETVTEPAKRTPRRKSTAKIDIPEEEIEKVKVSDNEEVQVPQKDTEPDKQEEPANKTVPEQIDNVDEPKEPPTKDDSETKEKTSEPSLPAISDNDEKLEKKEAIGSGRKPRGARKSIPAASSTPTRTSSRRKRPAADEAEVVHDSDTKILDLDTEMETDEIILPITPEKPAENFNEELPAAVVRSPTPDPESLNDTPVRNVIIDEDEEEEEGEEEEEEEENEEPPPVEPTPPAKDTLVRAGKRPFIVREGFQSNDTSRVTGSGGSKNSVEIMADTSKRSKFDISIDRLNRGSFALSSRFPRSIEDPTPPKEPRKEFMMPARLSPEDDSDREEEEIDDYADLTVAGSTIYIPRIAKNGNCVLHEFGDSVELPILPDEPVVEPPRTSDFDCWRPYSSILEQLNGVTAAINKRSGLVAVSLVYDPKNTNLFATGNVTALRAVCTSDLRIRMMHSAELSVKTGTLAEDKLTYSIPIFRSKAYSYLQRLDDSGKMREVNDILDRLSYPFKEHWTKKKPIFWPQAVRFGNLSEIFYKSRDRSKSDALLTVLRSASAYYDTAISTNLLSLKMDTGFVEINNEFRNIEIPIVQAMYFNDEAVKNAILKANELTFTGRNERTKTSLIAKVEDNEVEFLDEVQTKETPKKQSFEPRKPGNFVPDKSKLRINFSDSVTRVRRTGPSFDRDDMPSSSKASSSRDIEVLDDEEPGCSRTRARSPRVRSERSPAVRPQPTEERVFYLSDRIPPPEKREMRKKPMYFDPALIPKLPVSSRRPREPSPDMPFVMPSMGYRESSDNPLFRRVPRPAPGTIRRFPKPNISVLKNYETIPKPVKANAEEPPAKKALIEEVGSSVTMGPSSSLRMDDEVPGPSSSQANLSSDEPSTSRGKMF